MAENKIITVAELDIDISDSYKKTADLGKALDDLKAKKKALSKEDADYYQQVEKLNAEIGVTNKLYKNSQSITIAAVAAKNEEIGTIQQLEIQNKGLQASQKAVNLTTEDGTDKSKKYNDAIDANTSTVKENSSATKQQAMNIGNYAGSLTDVIEEQKALIASNGGVLGTFKAMQQSEGGVTGSMKGIASSIGDATKASLKFIATPIGLVLTAIVAAIGLFTAAVKGNQESADKFAKAWEGGKAVLDVVWGVVVKVGSALVEFASNIMHPIDAMKKLASSVKSSVPSFDEMTSAMKAAYNQGVQLKNMEIEYEKSKSKFIATQAELNKKLTEQNIIASNQTQAPKEIEKAQMALLATQLKIAEEKRKLAKQEMDIEQSKYDQAVKNGAGQNRDVIEKLNEAKAKYIESESEKTAALGEAHNKRRELANQDLQRNLDVMIDGYDSYKTMNEKIVNSDFETMDKRRAVLDFISKKSIETYNDQIAAINKFSGTKLDANKLIDQSDEKQLSSMIRNSGVSDENAGRVLEAVRERRAAIGDFYDAEQALATKSAEMKVSEMELELKKTIDLYSEKLKIDETFGKNQLKQGIQSAQAIADAQANINKTQLDNKLITQQEYDVKEYENGFALKQKIQELNKSFDDQDKARLKEVSDLNFANAMIAEADNYNSKLELQREQNKKLQAEEIMHAQKVGAGVTNINRKYEKINQALSKETTDAKLKLASDFASNISKIAGEATEVGKFAAAAAATINTYQAATGAYAAMASIPIVGPALGIAAAGAAIVSGFETVNKIYAVDTSGESQPSISATSSSGVSAPAANVNSTSAVGQGIVERTTSSGSNVQGTPQNVLVMTDVEYKQSQSSKAQKLSID